MSNQRRIRDRGDRVLNFIIRYRSEWGYPPNLREIVEEVSPGKSVGSISSLMSSLMLGGVLRSEYKQSRTLVVVDPCGLLPIVSAVVVEDFGTRSIRSRGHEVQKGRKVGR